MPLRPLVKLVRMDTSTVNTILREGSVPLCVLARECGSVSGRGRSRATMARWVTEGVKGVRLEGFFDGARWFSSRQALARFFAALSRAEAGATTMPTQPVPAPPVANRWEETRRKIMELRHKA